MSMKVLGQEENLALLEVAIKHDLPTLLIGETGTGKTSMIRELAKEHKAKLIRFTLTGETTVDDFVGKYTLISGETVWQDGILLSAIKSGDWLVVDEINVALPEILFVLHSLLDDDKSVTVPQHDAETIKPHKDFRFFATMNPTEEYSGTKELNKAFKSRFPVILLVGIPENKIERDVLKAHEPLLSDEDATKIMSVANFLRQQKKKEEIFYTCSTRDLIQWAKMTVLLNDLAQAFKVTILNKANGDSEKVKQTFENLIAGFREVQNRGQDITLEAIEAKFAELQAAKALFELEKKNLKEITAKEIVAQFLKP